MVNEKLFRCGLRFMLVGAVLHGMNQWSVAADVQPAHDQTSNASRGQQVQPVSQPTNEACGVAKVPGCTSAACAGGCANGICTNGAGAAGGMGTACGPNGCGPRHGGGRCACPACRGSRAAHSGNGAHDDPNSFSFRDAGQAWTGAWLSTRQAMFGWDHPQTDWNDEMNNGVCPAHGRRNCPHCCGWLHDQWNMFIARNQEQGAILGAHLHGKLAYFHPMGNGGEGVPPFGCYHLVYPANPSYSDPRDLQIYAAQGWGVPISVPLAPTVRHTMNYSTGIPSSRLTPISNVVPPRGRRAW